MEIQHPSSSQRLPPVQPACSPPGLPGPTGLAHLMRAPVHRSAYLLSVYSAFDLNCYINSARISKWKMRKKLPSGRWIGILGNCTREEDSWPRSCPLASWLLPYQRCSDGPLDSRSTGLSCVLLKNYLCGPLRRKLQLNIFFIWFFPEQLFYINRGHRLE